MRTCRGRVNLHAKKSVILGGGYAGVVAALNLSRKTSKKPVRITLVNAADHFVERFHLNQRTDGAACSVSPPPADPSEALIRLLSMRQPSVASPRQMTDVHEGDRC